VRHAERVGERIAVVEHEQQGVTAADGVEIGVRLFRRNRDRRREHGVDRRAGRTTRHRRIIPPLDPPAEARGCLVEQTRALRPGEIETLGDGRLEALEEVPGYAERSRVRPGLTGVAQIYAPRDITRRNKFRYDRVYIGRQSFWLDLRLVALSFWITFRGKWEVRTSKI